MSESFHSIAVVGAGLSGLYAAHLLKSRFPDVVLLEAQDRYGGRIKQVEGMTPWLIEAGPEFVHGSNSVFVRVAKQLGASFTEKDWPDWWHFEDKGLVFNDKVGEEVEKVHDLLGDCGDNEELPPPGKDISVEDWMRHKGCSATQMAVADACYANDFGCSLKQLGLRETIEENRGWDSGETYLLMDRSMRFIAQELAKGLSIRTNWRAASIEYAPGGGALVTAFDGRRVRCRKVLVTVPLRILQDGVIKFSPELPLAKRQAMGRIKMGNIIKLLLTFRQQFWPEGMYDVVCPGQLVPEFWMLRQKTVHPGAGNPHACVGFIAGERADAISAMDPADAANAFVKQLDKVFGTPSNPCPASSQLADFLVVDWSKEEHVRGGYTYPTLGVEPGDRAALAAPVGGTVFFAGEATNTQVNPCIQGAMATAERAAAEIAAAMQAEAVRSRL